MPDNDFTPALEQVHRQRMQAASDRKQLADLIRTGEAFRACMVQNTLMLVSQDKYMTELRAFEGALNPINYR